MLNPNLPHLNGHSVAEPPASASHEAILESALDVLVDHTFATSLTCLIFLCVALELVSLAVPPFAPLTKRAPPGNTAASRSESARCARALASSRIPSHLGRGVGDGGRNFSHNIVWLASLSVCVPPRRVVHAHLSNTIY